MSKITIVVQGHSIFDRPWLKELSSLYFNVVQYSDSATYDKRSTAYYVDTCDVNDQLVYKFLDNGFSVICDSMWELPTEYLAAQLPPDRVHVLTHPNWFWFNESLWLTDLGYANFAPQPNYSKLALMPLRLHRLHRVELLNALRDNLNDMTWSCVWEGKFLPGGGDCQSDWNKQRTLVPAWYNDTCFSLVAETQVEKSASIFITEKTFKPIAYCHPFIVWGQPGTLAYLHSQGFETFDELFDESYDAIENNSLRLDAIVKNVNRFKKVPYSKLTLDKLKHNQNLYFNSELVKQRIVDEIFKPLIEYVNKA